jgi:hypothetical protein
MFLKTLKKLKFVPVLFVRIKCLCCKLKMIFPRPFLCVLNGMILFVYFDYENFLNRNRREDELNRCYSVDLLLNEKNIRRIDEQISSMSDKNLFISSKSQILTNKTNSNSFCKLNFIILTNIHLNKFSFK